MVCFIVSHNVWLICYSCITPLGYIYQCFSNHKPLLKNNKINPWSCAGVTQTKCPLALSAQGSIIDLKIMNINLQHCAVCSSVNTFWIECGDNIDTTDGLAVCITRCLTFFFFPGINWNSMASEAGPEIFTGNRCRGMQSEARCRVEVGTWLANVHNERLRPQMHSLDRCRFPLHLWTLQRVNSVTYILALTHSQVSSFCQMWEEMLVNFSVPALLSVSSASIFRAHTQAIKSSEAHKPPLWHRR